MLAKTSKYGIFKNLIRSDAKTCENKILSDFYDDVIKIFDELEQEYLSTNHRLHIVKHEFNHLGQLKLLASRFRRIPEKFRNI